MRPDLHGKRERLLALLKQGMTLRQMAERGFSSATVHRLVREGRVEAVEHPDGEQARVYRAVEQR